MSSTHIDRIVERTVLCNWNNDGLMVRSRIDRRQLIDSVGEAGSDIGSE